MRVQERNVKISVTISTPSPVDVVETIAVGSVANKCVNFISQSVSIINDRAVVSKLVVDNTTPFRQRIITPVHESKSGCVVAEIRPKHMCGTSCYRTRPINAIFHLNSTSAMIHQCCHCIGLLVRIISTYILLQHFIIVIRCWGCSYYRWSKTTSTSIWRNIMLQLCWILVVSYHLRHCRSHTASRCLTICKRRTLIVVRSFLSPCYISKQWRNSDVCCCRRFGERIAFCHGSL